jgi:hypothetical protein
LTEKFRQNGVLKGKANRTAQHVLAADTPWVMPGPGNLPPQIESKTLAREFNEFRQGVRVFGRCTTKGTFDRWRGTHCHHCLSPSIFADLHVS